MKNTRIALGCDHAGLELKQHLKGLLLQQGLQVEDLGTHDGSSCDYPDFAHAVAAGVTEGRYDRGLLVCGTGLGMSYAANRHAGVRAALCTNEWPERITTPTCCAWARASSALAWRKRS